MIGINDAPAIPGSSLGQVCSAAAAVDITRLGDEAATTTDMRQCAPACPAEGVTRRVDVIAIHDFATVLAALISAIYSPQVALMALFNSSAVVFFRM